MKKAPAASQITARLQALQPLVDAHITVERMRRYVASISSIASPSTAASVLRGPVLRQLLQETNAFEKDNLHFHLNYQNTGSCLIFTGRKKVRKKLWYFAHLDTISYLVQPKQESRYPLVPFCHHMIQNGKRLAVAFRFNSSNSRYEIVAHGHLESENSCPFFRPENGNTILKPGDRIVLSTSYQENPLTGNFTAHIDNAGGAAALLAAAPVLAAAKVEALLAFPDEEEGPPGSGNQMMGRGSARILNLLPVPELVVVSDVQQTAPDGHHGQTPGHGADDARLGDGAILSEFSSLARGAVTPPHLYTLAVELIKALPELGVKVQISNNSYTSRSDDVSAMLKTPNILLLGFPGFNRHFDLGEPTANIYDLVNLAKSMVYFATLPAELQRICKQWEANTGCLMS